MSIEPGTFAVVSYRLSDPSGAELEVSASDEPITYVHGYGMLVPGLEAGLLGMRAGESKTIVVGVEDGFGERDEELVFAIARSELPAGESIEAGDYIVAEDPDGDSADLRVVEVHEEHVVVDANHTLAGRVLHFSVEVRSVRAATEDEITAANSTFGEGADNPAVQRLMRSAMQEMVRKNNPPN